MINVFHLGRGQLGGKCVKPCLKHLLKNNVSTLQYNQVEILEKCQKSLLFIGPAEVFAGTIIVENGSDMLLKLSKCNPRQIVLPVRVSQMVADKSVCHPRSFLLEHLCYTSSERALSH